MKKSKIANLVLLFFILIAFSSCKKSLDHRMVQFVSEYQNAIGPLTRDNNYISSSSAEKSGADEITIRFYLKDQAGEDIGLEMIKKSLPQVMAKALNKEKIGQDLVNDGVKFRIRVVDEKGKNVFYSETFDKNNIPKDDPANLLSTKNQDGEISQVLEVFNKNLPIIDPETGLKITKIELGKNQDIIYTAIVPNELKEAMKTEGAKEMMKEEMLRDPQIKMLLSRSHELNITKLSYHYKDEKGNLLSEVTISSSEIK